MSSTGLSTTQDVFQAYSLKLISVAEARHALGLDRQKETSADSSSEEET